MRQPPAHTTRSPHRTVGRAELSVVRAAGETRLARLYHKAPLRLLFPAEEVGEALTAAVVNLSGGLVGGDHLHLTAHAGPGARLRLAAQAAEKVYRTDGEPVVSETILTADPGAWLEWLPQDTILFDRAQLHRSTTLRTHGAAVMLAGDLLVLGRTAHGETLHSGCLRDHWQVWQDERLLWADRLHLDSPLRPVLDHPVGFAGAVATALLLVTNRPDSRDLLRALPPPPTGIRRGVTCVNGVVMARWLAEDALALRQDFATAWTTLRHALAALPPCLPRFWMV